MGDAQAVRFGGYTLRAAPGDALRAELSAPTGRTCIVVVELGDGHRVHLRGHSTAVYPPSVIDELCWRYIYLIHGRSFTEAPRTP